MRYAYALVPELEFEAETAPARGLPALPGFTPAESRAIWLTNHLETGQYGKLGYGMVSGDFDGMGISLGPLQWNFGSESLQPLLLRFARAAPARFQAVFGDGAAALLAMLTRWETNNRSKNAATRKTAQQELTRWGHAITLGAKDVKAPWKARFHALADEPAWREIVHRTIRDRMDRAHHWVREYGLTTERALAFMYDAVASHGGAWADRKGSNRRALIQQGLALQLARRLRPPDEVEKLEVIANVLGDTSAPRWREKARLRKLAIARNRGKVHGHELSTLHPIPLAPLTGGPAPSQAPAPAHVPGAGSTNGSPTGATLASWIRKPIDTWQVLKELSQGNRDVNDLTNKVFFARHPERNGARIQAHEKALAAEWVEIRDGLVKPLVAKHTGSPSTPPPVPFLAPGGGTYDGKTPAPGTTEKRRAHRTNPPLRSTEANRSAPLYDQVINQFAAGHNPRYFHVKKTDPKTGKTKISTYCNIFAWDVTSAMTAEVPHWVDRSGDPVDVGKGSELNANAVFDWLHKHGSRYGWDRVSAEEAVAAANQGRPVVASYKKSGGIGHISVVRPGDNHPKAGPLLAQAGAQNRNRIRTFGGDGEGVYGRGADVRFFAHA